MAWEPDMQEVEPAAERERKPQRMREGFGARFREIGGMSDGFDRRLLHAAPPSRLGPRECSRARPWPALFFSTHAHSGNPRFRTLHNLNRIMQVMASTPTATATAAPPPFHEH